MCEFCRFSKKMLPSIEGALTHDAYMECVLWMLRDRSGRVTMDDVLRLRLVNTQWRTLIDHDWLWQRAWGEDFPGCSSVVKGFVLCFFQAKHIGYTETRSLADEVIRRVIRRSIRVDRRVEKHVVFVVVAHKKICLGYAEDMYRICRGYVEDVCRMYAGCTLDV